VQQRRGRDVVDVKGDVPHTDMRHAQPFSLRWRRWLGEDDHHWDVCA